MKQLSLKKTMLTQTNKLSLTKLEKSPRYIYIYKRVNKIFAKKQIDDIKKSADNKKFAIAWHIVNKITGRKITSISRIKEKMTNAYT